MLDASIAIRIGSPQTNLFLVQQTIETIKQGMVGAKFKFILSLDPQIPQMVTEYVQSQKKQDPKLFELLEIETLYWSEFINQAIEKAQDSKFFFLAHDDIRLITPNFFQKFIETTSRIEEKYAWISFDDQAYYKKFWSSPTRVGYFIDARKEQGWQRHSLFQFHSLSDNWWQETHKERAIRLSRSHIDAILPEQVRKVLTAQLSIDHLQQLDMPVAPVKCHAPWNMWVAISTKVLHEIGPCEHWQTYNALLVDEDWGLRALQKKYWNIWIPQLAYEHVRTGVSTGGNRSEGMITKDGQRVHNAFKKKWGFASNPSDNELKSLQKKHARNYIPWSSKRRSYDWEYIK